MKKSNYILWFILFSCLGNFSFVKAQSGILLPQFGVQGTTIIDVDSHDVFEAVDIGPNGEIVAVGRTNYLQTTADFMIALFDELGNLDESFGTNGLITGSILDSGYNDAVAVVLTEDGHIYCAINAYKNGSQLTIHRYKMNGVQDSTYGDHGSFVFTYENRNWTANDIIYSHGNIFLSAESGALNVVAKIDDQGILDTAFGERGICILMNPYGRTSRINEIIEQADGKIVGVGTMNTVANEWSYQIIRINPDGFLDSSFGEAGIVSDITADSFSTATMEGVIIQEDGRIVAVGSFYQGINNATVIRLNSDGRLDSTFAGSGSMVIPTDGNNVMYAVDLLSDGNIIMAGDRRLLKILSTGAMDITFGMGGMIAFSNNAYDMKLDEDEHILIAGSWYNGNNLDLHLAKYSSSDASTTSRLNERAFNPEFHIYPNPTDHNLTFRYTLERSVPVQIALFDMLGHQLQIVKSSNVEAPGFHQESIFFQNHLKSGMYCIQIKIGNQIFNRKLFVK